MTVQNNNESAIINSSRPIHKSVTSTTTMVGPDDVSNYKSVFIQLSGTWDGSVAVELSNNNINFDQVVAFKVDGTKVLDLTSNGNFYIPITAKYFKLVSTAYNSGTIVADVTYSASSSGEPPGDHFSSWDTDSILTGNLTSTYSASASSPNTVMQSDNCERYTSIVMRITGSFSYATVQIQCSSDNGTTWDSVNMIQEFAQTNNRYVHESDGNQGLYIGILRGSQYRIYLNQCFGGSCVVDGYLTSANLSGETVELDGNSLTIIDSGLGILDQDLGTLITYASFQSTSYVGVPDSNTQRVALSSAQYNQTITSVSGDNLTQLAGGSSQVNIRHISIYNNSAVSVFVNLWVAEPAIGVDPANFIFGVAPHQSFSPNLGSGCLFDISCWVAFLNGPASVTGVGANDVIFNMTYDLGVP